MIGTIIVIIIVLIIAKGVYNNYKLSKEWTEVPHTQILTLIDTVEYTSGNPIKHFPESTTPETCLLTVSMNPQYKGYTFYDSTNKFRPNSCFATTAENAKVGETELTATSGFRKPVVEKYDNKQQLKMMRMGGASTEPMRGNKSGTSHFFANNVAGTFDAERFHARQTTVGTEWEGRY